ncbi:MAG: orotate phosphoribosyltransferase [Opitutae bacterium]|nr:orotate phosphoribosyltransferase [Opitutae bacterium]
MTPRQREILQIFESSKALLRGHFVLRSGLVSGHYFQCARLGERLEKVQRLAELLLEDLGDLEFETVLAPAMGGLVIGQEVARQAGARYIFAEKENDILVMRRGFKLAQGEKVLIVEDVITRGGRAREAIEIARRRRAEVVGLALLVDRSAGKAAFDLPVVSLAQFNFPTYHPENIPPELAALPPEKPGS